MRFVKENTIVDEFLFCQEMKERTRAKDVFDLVNAFLRENSIVGYGLKWYRYAQMVRPLWQGIDPVL